MGASERPPESLSYRLGDRAIATRARATAAIDLATAIAPIALTFVLLGRLGYSTPWWLWVVLGALAALAATRAVVGYRSLVRRLRKLGVTAGPDALVVETASARMEVGREAIERIVEVTGPLGGLRLVLARQPSPDVPERIDLPRGGDRFGDLRAHLARWRPVERAGRRSRAARVIVGIAIVAAIFFLPFVLEDLVARSRGLTLALVLGVWLAMRMVARRG